MNNYHQLLRFLSIVSGATLAAGPTVHSQTSSELQLQLYAGLNIKGTVGTVYSIDYVTDLAQTNANDWRSLTFLQLPATHYQWFDSMAPATATRFYRAVPFAAPTNMVFIPPGTFRMGSPTNEVGRNPHGPTTEEGIQTEVILSRGFWMGKYEVTQGEYQAVTGTNPSGFEGDPNLPVDSVTWFNATNYCGTLTQQARAAGRIPNNSVYRLPTEAEWEYAARALTSTRFSYGDDPDESRFSDYGWYEGNSSSTTHPVGLKLPNPWGLYDMRVPFATLCDARGQHAVALAA